MENKIKNVSILFVVLFINFLFAFKYFSRFSSHGLLVSMAYVGVVGILYYYLQRKNYVWFKSNLLFWGIVFLYSILHIILFSHFKVEQLNVDRWSVISGFWQNAFEGKYPYSAKSHMGNYPGPLPVYFLLTLPFYLIHEIGYFSLLGFIGFAWFIRKHMDIKRALSVLLLLVSSVALFWEISVRSTIFVNAVLFLFYLRWLTNISLSNSRHFIISAILGGLLLSTRSIFALMLVAYAIYMFKNKLANFKIMFCWAICIGLICSITFLPFIILYHREFLSINPFIIQSEFLIPFGYIPLLLAIALLGGLFCKAKKDLLFWIGQVIFGVFAIYALRICFIHDFANAYLNSVMDISYSLFCLPFVLYTLNNNNIRSEK